MSIFSQFTNLFYKHQTTPEPVKIQSDESEPENPEELKQFQDDGFEMSPLEAWRFNNFKSSHYKRHKEEGKQHHAGVSITFTPTGIGNGVVVKCLDCGEQLDITDYGCW